MDSVECKGCCDTSKHVGFCRLMKILLKKLLHDKELFMKYIPPMSILKHVIINSKTC